MARPQGTIMRYARGGHPPLTLLRHMHCAQAGSPPLSYVESLVRNFPSPIRNSSQVPDAAAVERLYACTKRNPVPNPNPNPNQVPDALDVYRRVLAASPARSVTIASVGLLTNLELLLRSAPDAHSPLTGQELVAEKVP
eukprot:scaffold16579_cov58-Phaeocystis_antarctica.AAC.3